MASVRAASVDGQADLANLVINPGFGSISEGAPDGWHTHSPRSVL